MYFYDKNSDSEFFVCKFIQMNTYDSKFVSVNQFVTHVSNWNRELHDLNLKVWNAIWKKLSIDHDNRIVEIDADIVKNIIVKRRLDCSIMRFMKSIVDVFIEFIESYWRSYNVMSIIQQYIIDHDWYKSLNEWILIWSMSLSQMLK